MKVTWILLLLLTACIKPEVTGSASSYSVLAENRDALQKNVRKIMDRCEYETDCFNHNLDKYKNETVCPDYRQYNFISSAACEKALDKLGQSVKQTFSATERGSARESFKRSSDNDRSERSDDNNQRARENQGCDNAIIERPIIHHGTDGTYLTGHAPWLFEVLEALKKAEDRGSEDYSCPPIPQTDACLACMEIHDSCIDFGSPYDLFASNCYGDPVWKVCSTFNDWLIDNPNVSRSDKDDNNDFTRSRDSCLQDRRANPTRPEDDGEPLDVFLKDCDLQYLVSVKEWVCNTNY